MTAEQLLALALLLANLVEGAGRFRRRTKPGTSPATLGPSDWRSGFGAIGMAEAVAA